MLKRAALFLAFTLLANQAHALNCTSRDSERLKGMYKMYVKSGIEPRPQLQGHTVTGSAVNVTGTVTGVMNYESCWKDSPPCNKPAQYDTATITFITTNAEVRNVYDGHADNALTECFRKLGLAQQPKETSGSFNRLFR